ncbi:MAG: GNAT family N-acetyltransferase [Bryobacterales bacterium]|nr:GNAT family N-acetyltransferase [Bryobacterales bacterium]
MTFRLARPGEYARLREMIISSFEPITWYKTLDEKYGPLNGCHWRERWEHRLDHIFETQIILAGEVDGRVVAVATGTVDEQARLGFVDLLGVDAECQGKGYGRLMLRGMLDHFRSLGMEYANLECLTDNTKGNALYQSEGWEIVASSHRWFRRI